MTLTGRAQRARRAVHAFTSIGPYGALYAASRTPGRTGAFGGFDQAGRAHCACACVLRSVGTLNPGSVNPGASEGENTDGGGVVIKGLE